MATRVAQPGPQCVYSKEWVCFFVMTCYLFKPESIQERIDDLDAMAGLPAVEQLRVGLNPVYKITLPLRNYSLFLSDRHTIHRRITGMETRTAILFADNEPAEWLQTEKE